MEQEPKPKKEEEEYDEGVKFLNTEKVMEEVEARNKGREPGGAEDVQFINIYETAERALNNSASIEEWKKLAEHISIKGKSRKEPYTGAELLDILKNAEGLSTDEERWNILRFMPRAIREHAFKLLKAEELKKKL